MYYMRYLGYLTLPALAILGVFSQSYGPVQAKDPSTVYVGSNKPAVEVNTHVLEQLGQQPNLPRLLLNRALGYEPHNKVRDALRIRRHESGNVAFPMPQNLRMPNVKNPPRSMQTARPKPMAKIAPIKANRPKPATITPVTKSPTAIAPVKPIATLPTVGVEAPEPRAIAAKPAKKITATAAVPRTPKPAKVAAVNTADTAGWQIIFGEGEAELSDSARAEIARIVASLSADKTTSLRIRAHADGQKLGAGNARRIALSRALKVRQALANEGFQKNHLKLEVIGDRDNSMPRDRVDIKPDRK